MFSLGILAAISVEFFNFFHRGVFKDVALLLLPHFISWSTTSLSGLILESVFRLMSSATPDSPRSPIWVEPSRGPWSFRMSNLRTGCSGGVCDKGVFFVEGEWLRRNSFLGGCWLQLYLGSECFRGVLIWSSFLQNVFLQLVF